MQLEKYMRVVRCPTCKGQRLNPQARAVRVGGKTLVEVCAMPIGDWCQWLEYRGRGEASGDLEELLDPIQRIIAVELLKEIRGRRRLSAQCRLALSVARSPAPILSGGETQRIRLAGQIGSGLVGVLYVLDEPSIGLHPRDNDRLLQSLQRLRDMGNTVLVVEHDEDTMRAADFLVDFGPGPGVRGGEVVAAGTFADIVGNAAQPDRPVSRRHHADSRSRQASAAERMRRSRSAGPAITTSRTSTSIFRWACSCASPASAGPASRR